MSNIEPTEEQRAAVRAIAEKEGARVQLWHLDEIARLLAEREAKLQARIDDLTERSARRLDDSTAIDALVYAIACLELQPGSERDRAVRDALNRVINHVGAIEVRARDSATKVVSTLVAGAKAREDALTARVAELEAEANDTRQELQMVFDDWNDMVRAIQAPAHGTAIARAKLLVQREAQHLADIKALHQFLGDHEEQEGIWIPRSKFKDVPCRKYLDDAKAAEGGEG